MSKIISTIGSVALVAFIFDVIIVLTMLLQIGSNQPTPHIAFWDSQVRIILSIVK